MPCAFHADINVGAICPRVTHPAHVVDVGPSIGRCHGRAPTALWFLSFHLYLSFILCSFISLFLYFSLSLSCALLPALLFSHSLSVYQFLFSLSLPFFPLHFLRSLSFVLWLLPLFLRVLHISRLVLHVDGGGLLHGAGDVNVGSAPICFCCVTARKHTSLAGHQHW